MRRGGVLAAVVSLCAVAAGVAVFYALSGGGGAGGQPSGGEESVRVVIEGPLDENGSTISPPPTRSALPSESG